MAVLTAAQVGTLQRPRETVPMPALGEGAEVIVQGVSLSERLALDMRLMSLSDVGPVPDPAQGATALDVEAWERRRLHARERAVAALVPETLALCVVGADGAPLMTVDGWEAFGARHPGAALQLLGVSHRLNGQDEDDTAKN